MGISPAGQEQQEPQDTVGISPVGQEQQEPQDTVEISPAGHGPQEPEQNWPCNCNKKICAQSVALWFGNFMVTAFLQLIGFHVFFMGLGVLATPVHSLSMICFFVSFFVLSIVFFAMLLKITNTENYCIFFFSFILAVLGLLSFISLVLYYYSYFLAVEDYNYDSGILTLLGRILPVAVSGFLIFCGKRLVQYVKEGGFAGLCLLRCVCRYCLYLAYLIFFVSLQF